LAVTSQGPVAFSLWWIPPVDENGVPHFLQEQLLNPQHQGTCDILSRLARQKFLHLALVALHRQLLGLYEFKNDFGFFDLYSYAQASAERVWPDYNFDTACAAYQREFDMLTLLHGGYSDRVLFAGGQR
jgi:hypothetical protein